MKLKNILGISLICSTLIFTGCGEKAVNANEEVKGTAVEVENIVLSEIAVENRLNGRVVSENEVSIYSPVSGEVKSVNVKVGDEVTKNTVLFTVDNASLMRSYQALVDDYIGRKIYLISKLL